LTKIAGADDASAIFLQQSRKTEYSTFRQLISEAHHLEDSSK